jgi:DNA-binding transcriptional regulator YiaG
MSGDDLKAARERLGMSRRAFARRLGVAPRTVERWEDEVHPIDPVCERLVLILDQKAEIERSRDRK